MLNGQHNHTLDDKGRVSIPAKFRQDLGASFVMSKGLDNCLWVFPLEEWKALEDKIKSLPLTNKNARNFSRFILGGATECSPDKQGRVMIPTNLRAHADLDKDAVIVGVSTRVEIWNKETWENTQDLTDEEEFASDLEDLGI